MDSDARTLGRPGDLCTSLLTCAAYPSITPGYILRTHLPGCWTDRCKHPTERRCTTGRRPMGSCQVRPALECGCRAKMHSVVEDDDSLSATRAAQDVSKIREPVVFSCCLSPAGQTRPRRDKSLQIGIRLSGTKGRRTYVVRRNCRLIRLLRPHTSSEVCFTFHHGETQEC